MIDNFLFNDKIIILGLLIISFILGFSINKVFIRLFLVIFKKIPFYIEIKNYFKFVSAFLLSVLFFSLTNGLIKYKSPQTDDIVTKIIEILYILFFGILSIKLTSFFEYILNEKQTRSINEFYKRQLSTQIKILKNIINTIIVIICLALISLSFSSLRQIGSTILTSVGIIGIIVGFAAQKTLNLIFAGIITAFSQAVKIGDVLIVEGEWGTVEEITLTNVVLKIWDQRRLVIPINYFVDKSFQNWTKTSIELLGTVYIYADYNINIDDLRKALKDILDSTTLWDKKTYGVQVTEATDRVIQIRALVSAKDSSDLWDLRCLVREKLIFYVKENWPNALPISRNLINFTNKEFIK